VSKQTLYNRLNAPDKGSFAEVIRIEAQMAEAWWGRLRLARRALCLNL